MMGPDQLGCAKNHIIVSHGRLDTDVPVSMSEKFVAAGRAAGLQVEAMFLERGDHYSVIDPSSPDWMLQRDAVLAVLLNQSRARL
jgi:hypothetical protein